MELSLEDIDHMKRSIEKSIPGEMSVGLETRTTIS